MVFLLTSELFSVVPLVRESPPFRRGAIPKRLLATVVAGASTVVASLWLGDCWLGEARPHSLYLLHILLGVLGKACSEKVRWGGGELGLL